MLVNLSKSRTYRSKISRQKKCLRKWWGYTKEDVKSIRFDTFFKATECTGVYEIEDFNCDERAIKIWTRQTPINDYDYGVADDISQIVDYYNRNRNKGNHVIFFKRIRKGENGGWRWHKWGRYIGTKSPRCEYLDNEPDINEVLVYTIYQVV